MTGSPVQGGNGLVRPAEGWGRALSARLMRVPPGRTVGAVQAGRMLALFGCLGLVAGLPNWHVPQAALAVDVADIAVGAVLWALPWERLPAGPEKALPLLAFAAILAGRVTGALPVSAAAAGYVLVFFWVGAWCTSRTVVAYAPVAAAVYLTTWFLRGHSAGRGPSVGGIAVAGGLLLPVAVTVGLRMSLRAAAERGRRSAEEHLAAVLAEAPVAIVAWDEHGRITCSQTKQTTSPLYAVPGSGLSAPVDVLGKSIFEVWAHNPPRLERMRRAMAGEEFSVEVDVGEAVLDVYYRPLTGPSGERRGAVSVSLNITERVRAEQERRELELQALAESRRLARTDELTGLPNRRCLYEYLDNRVGHTGSQGLVLMLLDLDRFKEVNDALGHSAGDELLSQVANRLSGALPEEGFIARLGGDEFAIALPSGGATLGETLAADLAGRVIECFEQPFELAGASVHVKASVGVAASPHHARARSPLMRCADVAMYRAKRARSGVAFYDKRADGRDRNRLVTAEQLRHAVASGELVCYFQPQVSMIDGSVMRTEALARWAHPERGVLLPGKFIPLAEQMGFMSPVSHCVLEYALAACKQWHEQGAAISVAVNLSVSDLLDTSLPARIESLLSRQGLRAEALVLEITEHMVMADPASAKAVIGQLRSLGLELSLDDYGTGYSSLEYIRDLPLHELKLDRSFISGITANLRNQAIVKATVSLARSLGMRLVAEGVEDRSDWDYLRSEQVDVAQGFAVAKPMCAEHFAEWLADWALKAARRDFALHPDLNQDLHGPEKCAARGCAPAPRPLVAPVASSAKDRPSPVLPPPKFPSFAPAHG